MLSRPLRRDEHLPSPDPLVRAAVVGSPVGHSLSPVLHLAAYAALGLTGWSYEAVEMTADAMPRFLAGLGASWRGLSVTMPLKEVALALAADATPLSTRVGAANTLLRDTSTGTWHADNTDVYGVTEALRGAGVLNADRALVLGSGATARAVVAALARLGVRDVTFAVRGRVRPETAALAAASGMSVRVEPLDHAPDLWAGMPVTVATLPGGTGPPWAADERRPVDGGRRDARVLLDVVYAGCPTPLARAFSAGGGVAVSGVEMLLHQAAEQVRLMTGRRPDIAPMRSAVRAAVVTASPEEG